jgi:AcrR family transcriptional regulator
MAAPADRATRTRRRWRQDAAERSRGGRGRRPLPTEYHRERLLRAAMTVACEHGYEGLTATAVVHRAGASRRTFYELFDSSEDCFLAALESCLDEIAAVVVPAYGATVAWPARLRAALVALLAFLETERDAGALVLSYLVGLGPRGFELRARVCELLRQAVDEGRSYAGPRDGGPSPLAAELVVGGALTVLHARARTREGELRALVNPLMWMIVLPYLGAAAANRELTRAAPKRVLAPAPARDPLRPLEIRLTYRTARVLEAIAREPGANNGQVAAGAGIADAGQASKLLARLARAGLVENTGVGQPRGGANAWRLTAAGAQLASVCESRARSAG